MVFATSFAILLGLNPNKDEPPPCDGDVDVFLDIDADGDQLRAALNGGTFGYSVSINGDGQTVVVGREAPPPEDVVSATTELAGSLGLPFGGDVVDASLVLNNKLGSYEAVVSIPVDADTVEVVLGDTVALVGVTSVDPTVGDYAWTVSAVDPSLLAERVDLLADTDGDGAYDTEAVALPTYQALALAVSGCAPDALPGDAVVLETDIDGDLQQTEAVLAQEEARLTSVTVKADGTLQIEGLEDTPGRIELAVFSHYDADGNLLEEIELPWVDGEVAFTSEPIDPSRLTIPLRKVKAARAAGLDAVLHTLDVDGTIADSLLVTDPLWTPTTRDGIVRIVSPLSSGGTFLNWDDSVLTVSSGSMELFLVDGRPLFSGGPIAMERSYLSARMRGGLTGQYTFDDGHTLDAALYAGPGRDGFLCGQTVHFLQAQFGEILIDGVVWELE